MFCVFVVIPSVNVIYQSIFFRIVSLTHWGRVTHICVSKLTITGSDNGLSPDRRQAIIRTNAGLLSIRPLRIYFSENWIKIQQFSLKKMHVKMSSAKWRPSCLGLNVLTPGPSYDCSGVDEVTMKAMDCYLLTLLDKFIFKAVIAYPHKKSVPHRYWEHREYEMHHNVDLTVFVQLVDTFLVWVSPSPFLSCLALLCLGF